MDMKNYLSRERTLKLSEVAKRMWPASRNPEVLLSMKLNDKRPWTDKDNVKAEAAVRKIHTDGLDQLANSY